MYKSVKFLNNNIEIKYTLGKIKDIFNKFTVYDLIIVFLFIVLFFNHFFNAIVTPVYISNTDPTTYNNKAIYFSKTFKFTDDYWPTGFYFIVGIIYKLFGVNYSIFKIFNVLMLMGTALLIFALIKKEKIFQLKNKKLFFIVFLILMIFDPEFLFYSSTLYKEIMFVFLSTLSMYFALTINDIKGIFRGILFGLVASFVGIIASEMNAWFIAPFFAGILVYSIKIYFDNGKLKKMFSYFIDFLKKNFVFLISVIVFFALFSLMFALIYFNSTGNFHVFSSNGGRLLFINNAPTGCEGVTFTIDNNNCVPDDSFMTEYARTFGKNYSSLSSYEQDKLKSKYVTGFLLKNPLKSFGRIIPFMKLWLFPSTQESQRLIIDNKGLTNYLWFTMILAVIGLVTVLIRKKLGAGWKWAAIFYFFCTFSYLMTYYLMRYRTYYRIFELLLASYAIYSLLELIRFNKIFEKIDIKVKPIFMISLVVIGLIFLLTFFMPYMKIRNDTSYNLLLNKISGRSLMQEDYLYKPILGSFNITNTDVCKDLFFSEKKSKIIESGIYEVYPLGWIIKNKKSFEEWLIRRYMTLNVMVLSDFDSLRQANGDTFVDVIVNMQRIKMPIYIVDGIILSSDFKYFYLNECN